MNVGHLARDADLVAVEVVGLLAAFAFFVGTVAYLRQWFVGIRVSVDIDMPAVRVGFLQEWLPSQTKRVSSSRSSEIGAVVLPSPQPSTTGEEVDVGMEKVYPTLL